MDKNFEIIFDKIILNQLKRLGKNESLKEILSKMFDLLEEKGKDVGKLLDSRLHIYELKHKRPPLRLYFKPAPDSNKIYLFEYELKTSKKKQKITLNKLKFKIKNFLGSFKILNLFW